MKKASYFVSEMARKHGARKYWVWEVLEAEFGIIKGTGAWIENQVWDEAERIIVSGLNGEW